MFGSFTELFICSSSSLVMCVCVCIYTHITQLLSSPVDGLFTMFVFANPSIITGNAYLRRPCDRISSVQFTTISISRYRT